jgi:hypothetical protein
MVIGFGWTMMGVHMMSATRRTNRIDSAILHEYHPPSAHACDFPKDSDKAAP